MRRTVRIDMRVEIVVDDNREGIPRSDIVMGSLLQEKTNGAD